MERRTVGVNLAGGMTSDVDPLRPPATVLPRNNQRPRAEEPEPLRLGRSSRRRRSVAGAIAAAVSTSLIVGPLLGLIPTGWLFVVGIALFVVYSVALEALHERLPAVRDHFWLLILYIACLVVLGALALVIGFILWQGQAVFATIDLTKWGNNFFTTDMGLTGPLSPITEGGILHALVGTLEQITIALAISIPLAIATGLYLNEIGGRYARLIRTVVEAMTALPSVVAGLFIYAAVIVLITRQFNGFAAALSITILMVPIMIRSADVVLRLVPGNLREAGLALGAGRWAVVRKVVLPTVRSGLVTAVILGTAHGIGETAPVLLTAGVTNNLNWNPFSGPQISLPLAALEFIKSPQPDMKARGFATAAFLLALVLVLFVMARLIGGQKAGEVSEATSRRLAARSEHDLSRVEANYNSILAGLGPAATTATAPPSRVSHITAPLGRETPRFPDERSNLTGGPK